MRIYLVSAKMTDSTSLESIQKIKDELSRIDDHKKKARITRFIVSAMGSIPWVGGFMGASAALHSEKEQDKVNDLQRLWFEEHQRKIEELAKTIFQIINRLESTGANSQKRIESEEYLALVSKGFREWDISETFEKKEYIRKLLTNACATTISTDDLIRLFIDWIRTYHETHFMVIKEIYKNRGITRGQIWRNLNPVRPREDSVEADLYKLLIRDLSTGGIIRQHRAVDYDGNFIRKKPIKRSNSGAYKSAFDEVEEYELTELGKQFVHYTMEDVITRLGD